MRVIYHKKLAVHCHSGLEPESRGKCWIPAYAGMTRRRAGVTLSEMTVVIAIAALMVGLAVPAINMLLNSFESESGAKSIINAALTSARAIAAKEQRYAGIRFQKRYDPDKTVLDASQYIIFIIQDPVILAYGFKAVDGIQPIKLPDSIGVMDLTLVQRTYANYTVTNITETPITNNLLINQPTEVNETTTFSVIFSPSGKLVIHQVDVKNRDGLRDTGAASISNDDIFNKKNQVDDGAAMFYQDDYCGASWSPWSGIDFGYGPEYSRNKFYIYETKKFRQTYNVGNPWNGYLNQISQNPVYVSPYTGKIINEK